MPKVSPVLTSLGRAALGCVIGYGLAGCSGGAADAPEDPLPPFSGMRGESSPPASGAGPGEAAPSDSPGAAAPGTPEQPAALPLAPGAGPAAGADDAANDAAAGSAPLEPGVLARALVYSRTAGYRHDSIAAGIEALRTLGAENAFDVVASEDPSRFTDDGLAGFDVIVFLSTTADVLDDAQQAALERYIRAGGGWVGVHAAADTEYDWPYYGQLLGGGAYFQSHPEIQSAQLVVEDAAHAATAHLPPTLQLEDEWYNFQINPRAAVSVLMTLDESSYTPGAGAMGADHPIAWYHEFDGGRAFYTALGHRPELYIEPVFTQHLLGALRWAAGAVPRE